MNFSHSHYLCTHTRRGRIYIHTIIFIINLRIYKQEIKYLYNSSNCTSGMSLETTAAVPAGHPLSDYIWDTTKFILLVQGKVAAKLNQHNESRQCRTPPRGQISRPPFIVSDQPHQTNYATGWIEGNEKKQSHIISMLHRKLSNL